MVFGAFLAFTSIHDFAGDSKRCRFHGRGRCSSTGRGSAHPHPLAAQVRHVFNQQEPGTRSRSPQEPGDRGQQEPGTQNQKPGSTNNLTHELRN